MKSSEIKLNTWYGIVPSWNYSNRTSRNPDLTTRGNVIKAKVLSFDKYTYSVWRTGDPDSANFTRTTKTAGFGYKVVDEAGTTYWVARPQDIVARYDVLEGRWVIQEAREKAAAEERDRKAAVERARQEEALNYANEAKARLELAISRITKLPVHLSVQTYDRDGAFSSKVDLNLRVLDALVERVLDVVEV